MNRKPLVVAALLLTMAALPSGAQAQAHPAPKPVAAGMHRDTSLVGIDTTGGKVEYTREVFHYAGGSRDPFQTLITSGGVGPGIADLRLVSITYDAVYGRSVAIVIETKGEKIHRLHRGDTVGRLRVLQIRQYEVVFQIEELGFERQAVLTLQRQAEASP
ncbi:MAG: hypothetical protein ABSG61_02095 [Gemmatimonadales bacterium]|jgi:hypothetical protein